MDEAEELFVPLYDEEIDDDNEENFEEIKELLNHAVDEDDDEATVYQLPPHRKCACHLLNMIATKDANKIDGVAKKTSVKAFAS